MVVTQDSALAERLRLLRCHGMTRDPAHLLRPAEGPWVYEQQLLGHNARMTELQAALGRSQLARLPQMQARREALAARYDRLLANLPLKRPARLADRASAWHLYAVEIDAERTVRSRREVFDALRAAQVGVNVHYIPIHTQPYYAALGFRRGDFPLAEACYAQSLSLPLFPDLSDAEQDVVVAVLQATLGDSPAPLHAPLPLRLQQSAVAS
jgi:dTDP-4-amino-4,6-dideoxygalactose transaminase